MFIGNIPAWLPESLVQNILEEIGSVYEWKRNKGNDGTLDSFGLVEFESIHILMISYIILSGLKIKGEFLKVKLGKKVNEFIAVHSLQEIDRLKESQDIKECIKVYQNNLKYQSQQKQQKVQFLIENFFSTKFVVSQKQEKTQALKLVEEKVELQKIKYGLVTEREEDELFRRELQELREEDRVYQQFKEQLIKDEEDLVRIRESRLSYDLENRFKKKSSSSLKQDKENREKRCAQREEDFGQSEFYIKIEQKQEFFKQEEIDQKEDQIEQIQLFTKQAQTILSHEQYIIEQDNKKETTDRVKIERNKLDLINGQI